MNKVATIGDVLYDNAIYLVLLGAFGIIMFTFVWQQSGGAAIWEQYYVAEIARTINLAENGDNIRIDVQKISEIARGNKVDNLESIFAFDNSKSEICLQLNVGRKTCLRYFNDVNIVDQKIEFGVPGNVLSFKIKDKIGVGGV